MAKKEGKLLLKVVGGNGELAVAKLLRPGPFLELLFHIPLFLEELSLVPPSPEEPHGEGQDYQEQGATDAHADHDAVLGRQ